MTELNGKREPFGKSPFHVKDGEGKDMPDISFAKLKKYYDDDPQIKELMRLAQKGRLNYTWQQKLYEEIFHQMMLYDNIIDLEPLKKIVEDGLKE